ncbi:chloroplast inner membrane localized [Micractinium conductrix]|uniref:Chloroplast inner membrane localized n=1 Tax=Micractinium conductrix TaxID=554055 RepID=A0A2P6V4P5_9CHLO|nr:chloroplast inner membrane localized [Micractinium conductrix]|eukprot:PSC69062.1 chloroplast inner membrane localized [Micractinium conductrix]
MSILAACQAGAQLQRARHGALTGAARPLAVRAAAPVRAARGTSLVVRAERGSGSFWSGVIVGGVVCGALGFVFAPQISKALLGDDERLKLRWDEAADGEVTKQNLADKIAQLNAAIDDVSSQLNARDSVLSKDEAVAP